MEGLLVERFIVGDLEGLFPGMTLVATREVIYGFTIKSWIIRGG
jgi:hypothetical protein